MTRGLVIALLALGACASPKPDRDSTTALMIDTVKPAPPLTDSRRADTSARVSTSTKGAITKGQPKTATKATKTKEPILRDSVITDRIKLIPIPESTKKKP